MNCIIIHGSNPKDKEKIKRGVPTQNKRNWLSWLKGKLEEKGIKTDTPLMPKNESPLYEDWKNEIENLFVDENTILVGQSAGGGFLVRWLGENEIKSKKLILVAPAIVHNEEYSYLEKMLKFKINKNIKNNTGEIVIFVSDDEREGIKKSVKILHEHLGGKLIELKGKGHFTMKYSIEKAFPELLKEVLE